MLPTCLIYAPQIISYAAIFIMVHRWIIPTLSILQISNWYSPLQEVSGLTNHTFSETSWHSHCPVTTHPSPTKHTQNPPDLTVSLLNDVIHFANHTICESSWHPLSTLTHWPLTHIDPPNSHWTQPNWQFYHFLTLSTIQIISFLKAHNTHYPVSTEPMTTHPLRDAPWEKNWIMCEKFIYHQRLWLTRIEHIQLCSFLSMSSFLSRAALKRKNTEKQVTLVTIKVPIITIIRIITIIPLSWAACWFSVFVKLN